MYNAYIFLVGENKSGRSKLINKLAEEKKLDVLPESLLVHISTGIMGINIRLNLDNADFSISLMERRNDPQLDEIRNKALAQADGFILLYDLTNHQSFESVKALYYDQIKKLRSLRDIPCYLFANKRDLEEQREVSFDEGKKFAEEEDFDKFAEISVINDPLSSTFDEFSKLVANNILEREKRGEPVKKKN